MTATQIIAAFELYVDDTTELSTVEELALLNKMYQRVSSDRPWEILKNEASGTMASTTTITMPTRFSQIADNLNYTDNSISTEINSRPAGILVNGNKWLKFINWSDRRQYTNVDGYAYVDIANAIIKTTYAQPSSATYSFDYIKYPADLTASDSPIFPDRFHHVFVHAMASDDMIIQLFDKARSYMEENRREYASYIQQMALWNANLQMA